MRRLVLALVLLAAGATAADAADPKATLRADVARARALDASAFVNVSAIVGGASSAHAAARGHRAPIARVLAKLGTAATLPMLELVAEGAPKGVPAAMAPVVRRDLIEALGLVGLQGDVRALPVLVPLLSEPGEDAESTRTTAEAVARIGTPEAASALVGALAGATPDRARALVAGMGECRRIVVTEAIARRLAGSPPDAMARAAARSLGRAGNAWAWKALADRSEETRIRETAARALVDAFVRLESSRDATSNALMVVDASVTPALIADARKTAAPAAQTALDGLATRFANNPSR